jgi:polyisoprenoid-binding protein YceI
MRSCFVSAVLAALVLSVPGAAPARAADDYVIDGMHSGVTFKISHMGLSWIYGRFDAFSGDITLDQDDPGKCAFTMTIKAESIDTNNAKRDEHLRSPDFFNVKQFPVLSFKSTAVKAVNGGYEVTGDFTMHGVTKSITFPLMGGKKAEFPKGTPRTGYTTELTLKRSEFGIDKFPEMLGEDVRIAISFEAMKK